MGHTLSCFGSTYFLFCQSFSFLSYFSSFQEFVNRMDAVKTTQTALLTEVQEQSAKFGDDVKYLVSMVVIR